MPTPQNKQDNIASIEQIIAKHYPHETAEDLLKRIQSLLGFVASLDPKLLAQTSKNKSVQTLQTANQPYMLHQFNNKNNTQRPVQHIHLEQENIRNTLLSQLTQLQAVSHLEPTQRISAAKKLK